MKCRAWRNGASPLWRYDPPEVDKVSNQNLLQEVFCRDESIFRNPDICGILHLDKSGLRMCGIVHLERITVNNIDFAVSIQEELFPGES